MIETIERWLEDEAKGKKVLFYIGLYIPLSLIISLLAINFFTSVHAPVANQTATTADLKSIGPIMVWPTLFVAAALEEWIFRLLPLIGALRVFGRRVVPILATAAAVSIIFGALHGNYSNIFLQGISGFMLSLLFLKCGGYNGKILKGFASSSLAHFLFNGLIAVTLFLH